MQEFTITRTPGYAFMGEIKVQITAPAGAAHSVLLGLALVAAISSGANLSSANLRSANLYGANLSSANLRSANLYGANLYGANLSGADLRSANLYGANLYGANLSGADLRSANLYGANLYGANLSGADLRSANLYGANLRSANLYGANLYGANLRSANLSGADLRSANLYGANLYGADLRSANLYGANLSSANLRSANLYGAKDPEKATWPGYQIPQEGPLIVWKKLTGGHLAKLQIPAAAQRTATPIGRKCRASAAKVVAIFDGDGHKLAKGAAIPSQHDRNFTYEAGATVTPDRYDPNPFVECSHGIHFFLTREEAEAW